MMMMHKITTVFFPKQLSRQVPLKTTITCLHLNWAPAPHYLRGRSWLLNEPQVNKGKYNYWIFSRTQPESHLKTITTTATSISNLCNSSLQITTSVPNQWSLFFRLLYFSCPYLSHRERRRGRREAKAAQTGRRGCACFVELSVKCLRVPSSPQILAHLASAGIYSAGRSREGILEGRETINGSARKERERCRRLSSVN